MHTYHSHYNFFKCIWCISCFIFHLSFCTVVIGQCNWIVGCDWTPEIGHMKQPLILSPLMQLNLPITELITITIETITYPEKKQQTNKPGKVPKWRNF